jgi:hypothetical protein
VTSTYKKRSGKHLLAARSTTLESWAIWLHSALSETALVEFLLPPLAATEEMRREMRMLENCILKD